MRLHYTVRRRQQRVTVGIPGSGIFLTEEAPLRRRGVQRRAPATSSFLIGVLLVIIILAAIGRW